ncbi:hypothetical protein BDW22DRAFT_1146203 [Trametopsis cervina]|nr:hypothetical protein BDW22DRAFT_1146203 [Trametopsis cervina]
MHPRKDTRASDQYLSVILWLSSGCQPDVISFNTPGGRPLWHGLEGFCSASTYDDSGSANARLSRADSLRCELLHAATLSRVDAQQVCGRHPHVSFFSRGSERIHPLGCGTTLPTDLLGNGGVELSQRRSPLPGSLLPNSHVSFLGWITHRRMHLATIGPRPNSVAHQPRFCMAVCSVGELGVVSAWKRDRCRCTRSGCIGGASLS